MKTGCSSSSQIPGFTRQQTEEAHREIGRNIFEVSRKLNRDFIIISRSDSTLRGHFPLETEVLKETLESCGYRKIHGEVIFPFFMEGGRYTAENIHYVLENGILVPAGETEFAQDKTFGYKESHLGKWIEEKSMGAYRAQDVTYISLESLRNFDIDFIVSQLMDVDNFNKVVVNAFDYIDVKIFTIALLEAMERGRNFLFRSAACFTKVIGGIPDKPLLTWGELVSPGGPGGLIIAASHVRKTTEQLEQLKKCKYVEMIEFNQHLITDPDMIDKEINRVSSLCMNIISGGQTAAVYTRRERFDLGTGNREEELMVSVKISDAVTEIVRQLKVRPSFIIAKGGITSSDIGVKGLGVKKALVAGQISPGIPVWITGKESKFPGLPYIIFPGNVGNPETLREITEKLMAQQ